MLHKVFAIFLVVFVESAEYPKFEPPQAVAAR